MNGAAHELSEDLDFLLKSDPLLWEKLRDQSVFITGGTGFFGAWILESFAWANRVLKLNAQMTVLTRSVQAFGQKYPHLVSDASIHLLVGDVRDGAWTQAYSKKQIDSVIHLATSADPRLIKQDPQSMRDTILKGTRNVLELARRSGTRRFLFASSGAVYASPDALSVYGESKKEAEQMVIEASKNSKLETVIARCFAFVGPYQSLDSGFAIADFIAQGLRGGPILVQGDGTPLRSYLYARDLTHWLWTILLNGQSGQAYDVGSEVEVPIAALARVVARVIDPKISVKIAQAPEAGKIPQKYIPRTEKTRKELGLSQTVDLAQAIAQTVRWHRSRPD